MTECSICVEVFNKTVHTICVCPHCNYSFCRKCIQTYILTIESYSISCMNCKKNWTVDTIDSYITKTFLNNQLKEHREKFLIDRERSLLPATLPEAYRISELKKHHEQLNVYRKKVREHSMRIYELNNNIKPIAKTTTVHFTIHCPVENCKGFIESTKWECGLCKAIVCKKCHECKNDDRHECNEANVETATLIKKDSKPCPGCSTLIFKISGCNQMWCTQCHTTFLWTTGAIVDGAIHNPHYYEWMRTHGGTPRRTVGDVQCGGIISLRQLRNILKNSENLEFVYDSHRIVVAIQTECLPYYRTDNVTNNQDLRVQFLLNEITEDQFRSILQKREKKTLRYSEIYDVLQMYLFTNIDLFNNLTIDLIATLATFKDDVNALRDFANVQFEKISKRYNSVVPIIQNNDVVTIKY